MRTRVRPAYSAEQLFEIYSHPWNAGHPPDRRVEQVETERLWITEHAETRTYQSVVVGLGQGIGQVGSIYDMSCGSGDIARMLGKYSGIEPTLGDLGPGYEYHGTLQETVPQLDIADLFILTETLEHLDDPTADLALIREHCRNLLVTTPESEGVANGDQPAVGHYWIWDRAGVEELLTGAGFTVRAYVLLDPTPELWAHCAFGMWMLR
jgi:Methyltransferase domain